MKILIYDDNLKDICHLKECIQSCFYKKGISYDIDICNSTEELYSCVHLYDLLFLDMKIHNESGIDIGMNLRKYRKNCRIIITTSYSRYAIDGYKIHADRYFLKPILQEEFNLEMEELIKNYYYQILGFYDKRISLNKIYYHQLLYVEFLSRKTIVHMCNGLTYELNDSLKSWYDKLKDYGFEYTHKSYIVNMKYVHSIANDSLFVAKKEVPLSRRFKKHFQQRYRNYLNEVM